MPVINYFKKISWFFILLMSACQSASIEATSQSMSSPSPPNPIGTSSLAKTSPTQSKLNPIFSSILPVLKAKTNFPVRIPTYIPESEGPNPIYGILESVTPSQYKIILAFTKDCLGGTTCRLGGVFGEAITPRTPRLMGKTVSLTNGVTGYFVDATCDVNCSDATLTWEQNGGRYTVAIKAGDLATLVKMANSAIATSPLTSYAREIFMTANDQIINRIEADFKQGGCPVPPNVYTIKLTRNGSSILNQSLDFDAVDANVERSFQFDLTEDQVPLKGTYQVEVSSETGPVRSYWIVRIVDSEGVGYVIPDENAGQLRLIDYGAGAHKVFGYQII